MPATNISDCGVPAYQSEGYGGAIYLIEGVWGVYFLLWGLWGAYYISVVKKCSIYESILLIVHKKKKKFGMVKFRRNQNAP